MSITNDKFIVQDMSLNSSNGGVAEIKLDELLKLLAGQRKTIEGGIAENAGSLSGGGTQLLFGTGSSAGVHYYIASDSELADSLAAGFRTLFSLGSSGDVKSRSDMHGIMHIPTTAFGSEAKIASAAEVQVYVNGLLLDQASSAVDMATGSSNASKYIVNGTGASSSIILGADAIADGDILKIMYLASAS
jgi:hypothetical protein